jgi:cobalt/nickel transport system ATP-binding protein
MYSMGEAAGGLKKCPCRTEKDIIHVDCASHVYPDGTLGIHDMCFHVERREIVAVRSQWLGKSTSEHLTG